MRSFATAILASLVASSHALLNCDISLDGAKYNLKPLSDGGERSISQSINTPPSLTNLTWYINPCTALSSSSDPDAKLCPEGTQSKHKVLRILIDANKYEVCGLQRIKPQDKDDWLLTGVIPVSGDLNGKQSGVNISRLEKTEDTDGGLQIHMKGGSWGDVGTLDALVDFVCVTQGDDKEKDILEFVNWDLHTLKLRWKTPHACALDSSSPPPKDGKDKDGDGGNKDEDGGDKGGSDDSSRSWGWFTWFFIILVLGSAFYIIASAWANYTRYGYVGVGSDSFTNSGGEFLREIPFLIRDFVKKVAGTFSGGNNRGGYSAV